MELGEWIGGWIIENSDTRGSDNRGSTVIVLCLYRVCASYPRLHIVPKAVSDADIEAVAGFRASRRFPSIVWRFVYSFIQQVHIKTICHQD